MSGHRSYADRADQVPRALDFGRDAIREGLPGLRLLLLAGPGPRRRRSGLDLAVAQHDHVRDLLLLGRPDLVLHPVRRVVDLHAQAAGSKQRRELVGGLDVPVGDRDDRRLDRRQPERERPAEVLDQDADEPLERAVDGAVDGDRPLWLAVLVDVGEVEPLREHRRGRPGWSPSATRAPARRRCRCRSSARRTCRPSA